MQLHTFDLIRFYHDRPETELATWEAESLADAKSKAMRHIDALQIGHDASISFCLFCDDSPTFSFDSVAKVTGCQLPDCEVCDDEPADPSACVDLGENLCSACADEWDSDFARSYGPRAEIDRLRESLN